MTDERNIEEITKPIPVDSQPEEEVSQDENLSIPKWLLDFASEPDGLVEVQPAETLQAESLDANELLVDDDHAVILEGTEWQPVQTEPEDAQDAIKATTQDPTSQLSELGELLQSGDYAQFAIKFQGSPLTQDDKQALCTLLRPHLTLNESTADLWDIYDHINEPTGYN